MKHRFPDDFLWGTATAAFQIEGAPDADGKGPSIWDVFASIPGRVAGGRSILSACDHYHRWQEDVAVLRQLNQNAYRFSLSWPRVLPAGRGAANAAGWDFYDRLVDALLEAGIRPMVTLYHWDLPAALQMELGGWLHDDLPAIFAEYAGAAFERLGDRVRHWVTLNEPQVVTMAGHIDGCHAPGVRDRRRGYRVAHNLLRAHGLAVERFRQGRPKGQIGLVVNAAYDYPATDSAADREAAERAMLDLTGWFVHPAYFGDYPAVLRERLGELLPPFDAEDTRHLLRSLDFLGVNYYFSELARHDPQAGPLELARLHPPDRPKTEMDWPIMPEGLTDLLEWLSATYPATPLYITENGAAFDDRPDADGFVDDRNRIAYLHDHFGAAADAIERGVDLRGYFVWSLMDNVEWASGYTKRFGLVRCDPDTKGRTIKASGRWYADFLAGKHESPSLARRR